MTHPTDPYRDNPAHREIADLQQRLNAVAHAAEEARKARGMACTRANHLKAALRDSRRNLILGLRRTVTAGTLAAVVCWVVGYYMGAAPRGSAAWGFGWSILGVLVLFAATVLFAVWTDHHYDA